MKLLYIFKHSRQTAHLQMDGKKILFKRPSNRYLAEIGYFINPMSQ